MRQYDPQAFLPTEVIKVALPPADVQRCGALVRAAGFGQQVVYRRCAGWMVAIRSKVPVCLMHRSCELVLAITEVPT